MVFYKLFGNLEQLRVGPSLARGVTQFKTALINYRLMTDDCLANFNFYVIGQRVGYTGQNVTGIFLGV